MQKYSASEQLGNSRDVSYRKLSLNTLTLTEPFISGEGLENISTPRGLIFQSCVWRWIWNFQRDSKSFQTHVRKAPTSFPLFAVTNGTASIPACPRLLCSGRPCHKGECAEAGSQGPSWGTFQAPWFLAENGHKQDRFSFFFCLPHFYQRKS